MVCVTAPVGDLLSDAVVVDPDIKCALLAAVQHGVLTRAQCRAEGLTGKQIDNRIARQRLLVIHKGVYEYLGSPNTGWKYVMAACLHGGRGAAASHATAGLLHRLDRVRPSRIEVSTTSDRRTRKSNDRVRIHTVRSLPDHHKTEIQGIPVTTAARSILDLAGSETRWVLDAAIDCSIRRKLTSLDELHSVLEEEARPGRNGITRLRERLAIRDPALSVPHSVLEGELFALLEGSGIPTPDRHFTITGPDGFHAEADLAYPLQRLVVEVQGYEHHSSLHAFNSDADRMGEIVALGWALVNVTAEQIRRRPHQLIDRFQRLLTRPRLGI